MICAIHEVQQVKLQAKLTLIENYENKKKNDGKNTHNAQIEIKRGNKIQ